MASDRTTRRRLISGLAVTAAAAAAAPARGAAASSIQRIPAPQGLQRPQINGRDIYSHVVATARTRTVHVAGQLARDAQGNMVGKGDMRAQMRQVCENIKAALAAVGGTLDDVVSTSTFITDWAEFRKAMDVRHEYFGSVLPTSTTVQVSALAAPEFMIEISAIAMLES
jgi:2-iminobutanoate/2-iminopropanoate deaminase